MKQEILDLAKKYDPDIVPYLKQEIATLQKERATIQSELASMSSVFNSNNKNSDTSKSSIFSS